MNEGTMREAIDKAAADIKGLLEEKAATLIRDMSDSFVQQSAEDPDKKLKYGFTISVTIKPAGNCMVVKTRLNNAVKRSVDAESTVG